MRASQVERPHHRIPRLLHSDSGATVVEYALVVGLIALVAVSAVALLGTKVAPLFVGTPF